MHISLRLKAARIKNLLIFTIKLRRKLFAKELKHIRNELLKTGWRNDQITHNQRNQIPKISDFYLKSYKNIPVFIITRDRLSDLLQLINWFENNGMKKIIIVDNDSLYPPLISYLRKVPYQVIKTRSNIGHKVIWESGIVKTLIPNSFYILSDPDIIPNSPIGSVKYLMQLHQKYPEYQKIGFGLDIDDLPDSFCNKKTVIDWESQFWTNKIEKEVYEAGLDTTFAVYKSFNYKYFLHPSLRTGKPYTAKHMPWYINSSMPLSKEEAFYRFRVSGDISTWNLDNVPEKYLAELKRQGVLN
jgi:hypothetical protein